MERLWPLAGPTELAGQGLIHVELRGYGTAAIEVQVVLAAQLAVLAQGWLAGRALLFKVTTQCARAWKGSEANKYTIRHVKMKTNLITY